MVELCHVARGFRVDTAQFYSRQSDGGTEKQLIFQGELRDDVREMLAEVAKIVPARWAGDVAREQRRNFRVL